MSNCDFVAGGSLIDLATSRLALRAPALRAATALTRPNQSAQWLPCGRHTVPTAKMVGPNNIVAKHCVEVSRGLATLIEKAVSQWGLPNGYVLGEEAGAAFFGGLRYGEGMLYTKNAGDLKVYWQGPSVGWDFGGEVRGQ